MLPKKRKMILLETITYTSLIQLQICPIKVMVDSRLLETG